MSESGGFFVVLVPDEGEDKRADQTYREANHGKEAPGDAMDVEYAGYGSRELSGSHDETIGVYAKVELTDQERWAEVNDGTREVNDEHQDCHPP